MGGEGGVVMRGLVDTGIESKRYGWMGTEIVRERSGRKYGWMDGLGCYCPRLDVLSRRGIIIAHIYQGNK